MGGYVLAVGTTPTRLSVGRARILTIINDGTENVHFELNSDARANASAFVAIGESITFDLAAAGVEDIDSITFVSPTVTNNIRLWVI